MNRQLLRTILQLVAIVVAATAGVASAADQSTTIRRDEFGVPHIFAASLEHAAYAAGYAQAEDRLEELLKNYRRLRNHGRSVWRRQFRRRSSSGAMRHAAVSQAKYHEISPKMRGVIDGTRRGSSSS